MIETEDSFLQAIGEIRYEFKIYRIMQNGIIILSFIQEYISHNASYHPGAFVNGGIPTLYTVEPSAVVAEI